MLNRNLQRKESGPSTDRCGKPAPPCQSRLLRASQIYGPEGLIPVSRSTWLAGVRSGVFPSPIKLSKRVTVWRLEDIEAYIQSLTAKSTSPLSNATRDA